MEKDKRCDTEFFAFLKSRKCKPSAAEIKALRKAWGEVSEDAPEVLNNPYKAGSGFMEDGNLNDTENVPFKQDVDEYFEREVLPFTPDAWMDRTKDKVGCEFPFTKLFYVSIAPCATSMPSLPTLGGSMRRRRKSWKVLGVSC